MRARSIAIAVVLATCCALICSGQTGTNDQGVAPESYAVYSALLSSEFKQFPIELQKSLSIRPMTFDLGTGVERCFESKEASVLEAIQDFKTANRTSWRLQDRFSIDTPHKLSYDARPDFLQFSAVGFNDDKSVAVVRMSVGKRLINSSTVEGKVAAFILRKENGTWVRTASGCQTDYAAFGHEVQFAGDKH